MGRFYLPPQVLVAVAVLAAVGALLLVLARPASGREEEKPEPAARASVPPPAAAVPVDRAVLAAVVQPAAEPEPAPASAPPADPGFLVLRPAPGSLLVVRARPGGAVVARLGRRTEFGSPTTLAVAAKRGRWLGVVTTHLPNGRLGWVDPAESAVVRSRTRVRVTIDLSARRLVVRRGDRVLRRVTVAVGRPSSPTPTGRFAVTDKLAGARFSSSYGCCILALSAHQPNLPPGWQGGDRIAVHGTNDPGSIGTAASAGCPRASDADMRYLLRTVPLGAPVFVRA
ncbi:MAG TPA: L,D-transpeptidase [Gaiellaceae bacterium]|nr:L,D-transpeptidase [Gaiellaceae bacterium]